MLRTSKVVVAQSPDAVETVNKIVPALHSTTVHKANRSSPLSKEAPEQNFRGLYNLALLLLFVLNLRLIVENYLKYGFRVSFPAANVIGDDAASLALGIIMLTANVLFSYTLELMNAAGYTISLVASFNTFLTLAVPTYITWNGLSNPLCGFSLLMLTTIVFLKLVSFHLTNNELKHQKSSTETADIKYPKNLTLSSMSYFIFAPTLVYQTTYPRSPKFRASEFFKRLLELAITSLMGYVLIAQYAIPLLENSIDAVENKHYLTLFERVLKLSVVSVLIWLLMFYAFFHSALNALSEVMRFGDRLFYQSWWNSTIIGEYWRQWNLPVYNWSKRHIFVPMVKRGYSSGFASLTVFFVSALLHELIIAVPTHRINGLAFAGMLGQIPLIYLTAYIQSLRGQENAVFYDTIGNMIFWISITLVGQPTAIILYYASWSKRI